MTECNEEAIIVACGPSQRSQWGVLTECQASIVQSNQAAMRILAWTAIFISES
jgi:hypothetical protein